MQRRHHYEQAFESYLRSRRIPYVAVDEARKALLPGTTPAGAKTLDAALKSFDAIIYGQDVNLLVEVKGRRAAAFPSHLQNWVTLDDVESLSRWESLFGSGFEAAFVFIYWCQDSPPDGLFDEIFTHAGRCYALRVVRLTEYRSAMRLRSARWRTVHLATSSFARLATPLARGRAPDAAPSGGAIGLDPDLALLEPAPMFR